MPISALHLLRACACGCVIALSSPHAWGDEPSVSYIFPAGAQRGTSVDFHVGGHYLHDRCEFHISGEGMDASSELVRGKANLWFEGPRIPLPASQRKEDYPWPQQGKLTVDPDASPGLRYWRVRTSQGMTAPLLFVVGDLPEIIEQEMDGAPLPVEVQLPVTINGRIFPREDVDLWTFPCEKGRQYACEVLAARIGSPLDSRLQVTGPSGKRIAENVDALGADSRLTFVAAEDGLHQVRIDDAKFRGLQDYIYRLTITAGPHVMGVYPLGGQAGADTTFHWLGANIGKGNSQQVVHLTTDAPAGHWLTLGGCNTLPLQVDVSEQTEFVEPLTGGATNIKFQVPGVINGRLDAATQQDHWQFDAAKGKPLTFIVKAAQLGSPLDCVLEIRDTDGNVLAENDDGHPSGDPKLSWTPPKDGVYALVVRDAFGNDTTDREYLNDLYCYRVTCDDQPVVKDNYNFELSVATDTMAAPIGGSSSLEIKVVRPGNFKEPIVVKAEGLPQGVTCEPVTIKKGAKKASLQFQLAADLPMTLANIRLSATVQPAAKEQEKAKKGKKEQPAKAADAATNKEADVPEPVQRFVQVTSPASANETQLTIVPTIATPFKFVGDFETKYGACGSLFGRSFKIERNGFEGPLRVCLAERQVRHLQGVTGEEVIVPTGADTFHYTIRLAPWMEVGRTSRTCLMLAGEVKGADGKLHQVSYTSHAQNDQIIVLIDPAPLSVEPAIKSITPEPGAEIELPVRVARGTDVSGAVRLELVCPQHYDIQCDAVVIPAAQNDGTLTIRFGAKSQPFNAPIKIRATTLGSESYVAEATVEL